MVALHSGNRDGVVSMDSQVETVPGPQCHRGPPPATGVSDPEHVAVLQYTYFSCLLYAHNNYHRFDFNCITLISVSSLSCEKSQGIFGYIVLCFCLLLSLSLSELTHLRAETVQKLRGDRNAGALFYGNARAAGVSYFHYPSHKAIFGQQWGFVSTSFIVVKIFNTICELNNTFGN